ncbi:trypsin-like peptidase domain-containing protein [Burkholderiaceae bacterium DAT-1]|nr:trypsin-like peptidase domain-containing protein [Burkholderiaceae bacterium DAT-1]
MKRLWLIFAQTTTIGLAGWFLLTVLKPEWLPRRVSDVVTIREAMNDNKATPIAPSSYRAAVRKAMPSVVNIYTSKEIKRRNHPLLDDPVIRRFLGGDRNDQQGGEKVASLGSGVIVSDKGYIVTNNHVVQSVDAIHVMLSDGRAADAKLVGTDPETDLAVIRIDLDKLPAVTLAPRDSVNVGDVVLAIGNPFNVGQTVTSGIVSALGRTTRMNTFESFIQTDAAINPGNSGGALIDTQGNLIGINTAIYSQTGGSMGIGFAIPTSIVKEVMEALIRDGTVTRGWIGIEARSLTPDVAQTFKLPVSEGALIGGVVKSGPAWQGGIKPGDVLVGVNDHPVRDVDGMLANIASLSPGQKADIRIYRGNQALNVPVVIARRPKMKVQYDDEEDDAQ